MEAVKRQVTFRTSHATPDTRRSFREVDEGKRYDFRHPTFRVLDEGTRVNNFTQLELTDEGLRSGRIPTEEFTWQGPLHMTSGKTSGWRSRMRRFWSSIRRDG